MVSKLNEFGQQHLLKFVNELSENQKNSLFKQIDNLDFEYLKCLKQQLKQNNLAFAPIKVLTTNQIKQNECVYKQKGLQMLETKQVAALLLAGGMGTRLGSSQPKGMYNIGITQDVYIYQRLFENLLEVVKQCGVFIPFFIMTSDKTHDATVEFLNKHNFFGYDKNYISIFKQDMAPCVDFSGKILLENKYTVASSPNGNGGWFNSLIKDKHANQMLKKFDIKWINFFSVDNVLQKIADPVFVGAVVDNYQIGAKVIKKADPYEKVGVMCLKNGRPSIVEYLDLPQEMALETNENGERLYNYGVILNYLFSVDLLYKIKDKKLPVRVVTKKVECIDDDGHRLVPQTPNAHKFELLCTDMLELCDRCLPFEVERCKEFAPIKNKTGVDSVQSAQMLLQQNCYKL